MRRDAHAPAWPVIDDKLAPHKFFGHAGGIVAAHGNGAAPLVMMARARHLKSSLFRQFNQPRRLPDTLLPNSLNANFIDDFVTTLRGVQCRDRGRPVKKAS